MWSGSELLLLFWCLYGKHQNNPFQAGGLCRINRLFCSTPLSKHTMGFSQLVNSKHMSGAAGLASTQRWDINGAKIMGLLYDNELQSGEDRGSLYTEQLHC